MARAVRHEAIARLDDAADGHGVPGRGRAPAEAEEAQDRHARSRLSRVAGSHTHWPTSAGWRSVRAVRREITLAELAAHAGVGEADVRDWNAAGILGAPGRTTFEPEDLGRVEIFALLARRGLSRDDIVAWARRGTVEHYVAGAPAAIKGPTCSLAEAAAEAGVPLPLVEQLWETSGFRRDERVGADAVEYLRAMAATRDAGYPDDALVQLARVFADGMRRISDAQARLFQFHVREAVRARGLTGAALSQALWEKAAALQPITDRVVRYLNARFLHEVLCEDIVLRAAGDLPGELTLALAFLDLASFTPLTEAMGDARSADVLDRFAALVRRAVSRAGGRVVKQIGDAFMLAFVAPGPAVDCALAIEAEAAREPQFPALRAGVHWGTVVYREGDYVGTTVNVAARVAAAADRHQVLVTAAVREAGAGREGLEWIPVPPRRLKGLAEAVALFEVRAAGRVRAPRLVDPVCGMELAAADVAVRLTVEGTEHAFCSEACRRRFVEAPERYGAPRGRS